MENNQTSPSSKGYVDALLTRQGRKAMRATEIGDDAQVTHEEVVKAGGKRLLGRIAAVGAAAALILPGPRHEIGQQFDRMVSAQDRAPVPGQTYATPNGSAVAPETPAPAPTAAPTETQNH